MKHSATHPHQNPTLPRLYFPALPTMPACLMRWMAPSSRRAKQLRAHVQEGGVVQARGRRGLLHQAKAESEETSMFSRWKMRMIRSFRTTSAMIILMMVAGGCARSTLRKRSPLPHFSRNPSDFSAASPDEFEAATAGAYLSLPPPSSQSAII